jgi:Type II secretion system (T2SS), protein E, N-terminal domain
VKDDALALAFRTGLPFVGLRDHQHDPELDRFIPPDAARAARVVLLSAGDDHLRLALADPEADLTALRPYLGDRRVELAVAAEDELEALLGPALSTPLAPEPEPEQPPALVEPPPERPADGEPEEPKAEPIAAEPGEPEQPKPEAIATEAQAAGAESEPVAAEPQPVADEPGEVPSWLEPPRRRRKLAVVMIIILMLLVVAAGVATAYLVTR